MSVGGLRLQSDQMLTVQGSRPVTYVTSEIGGYRKAEAVHMSCDEHGNWTITAVYADGTRDWHNRVPFSVERLEG